MLEDYFVKPTTCDRIIANLLSNARRYSPPGSEVSVAAENSEGELLTRVIDRGSGIARENQERIFEKFAQAGSGRTANSSAIGLTFCKLVVEKHGGRIGVTSELGKGSEFWFRIPR